MELVQLSCNGCGADIELPDDARFVTCRYCKAKLEVGHTDGAAFTRVREAVARVEKKTEAIADEVKQLRAENRALALKNDLEELDRDWAERKQGLMNRAKDGALTAPTRASALAIGVIAAGAGLTFALSMSGDAGLMLGLAFAALGVGAALVQHQKAVRYEDAHSEHLDRRSEMEAALEKAERRARGRKRGG